MRKTLKVVLVLLALLLVGCERGDYESNVEVNGATFSKYYSQSNKGVLSQDAEIQNWPCKKGWVFFYDNQQLETLCISKDVKFSDFIIPAGSWVNLDKDGDVRIIYFSKDTMVQGYPCRGSILGREGIQTSFYKNGKLNCFFPDDDVVVDNIPCKGSVFYITQLYDDGKLKRCRLSRATEIDGKYYKKGTTLKFDRAGKVLGAGK